MFWRVKLNKLLQYKIDLHKKEHHQQEKKQESPACNPPETSRQGELHKNIREEAMKV